ncbi:MAG: type II toxin-antitoxin system VapC family toxin [Proteobacteria bacterium]|nr:type II toxin-antitoxin system VapC family toxin [Pseudomonadota bacterium]
MIYVDTSVLVALLTVEPMTPAVKRWYAAASQRLASADWCLTEFASAIALKTRTGQLSKEQAVGVTKLFDSLVADGLRLLPVSRAAFREAAFWVSDYQSGLRAGDALHLAVAREVAVNRMATLDRRMAANAIRLGFAVESF